MTAGPRHRTAGFGGGAADGCGHGGRRMTDFDHGDRLIAFTQGDRMIASAQGDRMADRHGSAA